MIAGDNFGSLCHYRSELECGLSDTACSETGAFGGGGEGQGSLVVSSCFCDHCTNLPLVYESFGSLTVQLANSNAGDDTTSIVAGMCRWITTIECFATNAACAELRSESSSLTEMLQLKDSCMQNNMALDFATSYSYQSPTCGSSETSGAVKLLQLKLLAASFLLAILN